MPISPEGEQIANFLQMYVKEDRTQRPELTLGGAVLTRAELKMFAEMIGEKFRKGMDGHEIGALEMVPTFNEWLLAGRFDHLLKAAPTSGATPAEAARLATLEQENLTLREQVTDLARTVHGFMKARSGAEADAALAGADEAALREIEDDPILSDPDIVGPLDHLQPAFDIKDEAELDALPLPDLRALSRSLGIETKKRSADEMRLDIKVLYGMVRDANGNYAGVPPRPDDLEEATDVAHAAE